MEKNNYCPDCEKHKKHIQHLRQGLEEIFDIAAVSDDAVAFYCTLAKAALSYTPEDTEDGR